VRLILILCCFLSFNLLANNGLIVGEVRNELTNEPIEFATIYIQGTGLGTTTDSLGIFRIELEAGVYNLEIAYLGFETAVLYSKPVSSAQPNYLQITLNPALTQLEEVKVLGKKNAVSPIYSDQISAFEIVTLPGATMDLSKYVKALPGVSPKVSFGYSMIVRGGASNENRFFLDDIEIPSITHFAVQGNNGGPNGVLNTRVLESAELFTDGMPLNRSNALSSVLEVKSRLGSKEKFSGNFTLGATDWGFVLEGPMGKKSSYVFSARESFSQHMLKALGIPVIPFYSDVSYAQKINLNPKTEINFLALGVYDKYTLNLDADPSPSLMYNIGYIPEGKQLAFTTGVSIKRFHESGHSKFVLSRNYFNNRADKFYGNSYEEVDRLLQYHSIEAATKARYERKFISGNRKIDFGLEWSNEHIHTINKSPSLLSDLSIYTKDYDADLRYQRFGMFYNTEFIVGAEKDWVFDLGLRTDASTYNKSMRNPLNQIAPRIGLKHILSEKLDYNINIGRYTQLPSNIVLSYSESDSFVNRSSLKTIKSDQLSTSIRYSNSKNFQSRFSLFYKSYSDYPMLLDDGISLANANANYVVVGDQGANSDSKGRAFGAEVFAKQKFTGGWSYLISASYVRSMFTNADGIYTSSAWDNRVFSTMNLSKRFKSNWTIAAKWSLAGGNPYTPYNMALSSSQEYWAVFQRGIHDYSAINEARLPFFHQLDIRIDRQFNFKKWAFTFYIDIQNAYKSNISQIPYLSVIYDEQNWTPRADPIDPSRYLMEQLPSDSGRILPSIGLFFDF
jgi:hypothetical protein